MAKDDSLQTNEPTFHRGLEEFIPWALGHLSVGLYREGETTYFLQLTLHEDNYYVWNRRCIQRRGGDNVVSGVQHTAAKQIIAPPLAVYPRAEVRGWVGNRRRDRNRYQGIPYSREWAAGARYSEQVSYSVGEAWIPGIQLVENIDLTADFIQRQAEGRIARIAIEHYGIDRYLQELRLQIIDQAPDAVLWGQMNPIWERERGPDNYHYRTSDNFFLPLDAIYQPGANAYLVVTDTTSGERTVLRVPGEMRTVLAAKAWTFGVQPQDYAPQIEA